ncbi:uncharacterized protein LOC144910446 isoform X2 [Branchiostoma floridae x Branchiostoma belcheri]
MKTSTAKPWHTSFHLGQSKTSQRAQPPLSQPCHSHNIQIGPGLFDFSLSFLTQHFIDLIVEEDTAGRLQRAKPEPHQRMTQTAKTSPNQSPTQETGKLTWHYLSDTRGTGDRDTFGPLREASAFVREPCPATGLRTRPAVRRVAATE